MTQLATPASVVGDFNLPSLTTGGKNYKFERIGDEYFVELAADLLESEDGKGSKRARRKILMTTGSHHVQFYWMASGIARGMEQLPLAWLIHEGRWTPRNATFLTPPGLPEDKNIGRWNEICIRCHSTGGRPEIVGNKESYSEVSEFGISCEACHGPGRAHVEYYQAPARRYSTHLGDSGEATVKNPENLLHPQDSQVCAQCHSLNMEKTAEVRRQWLKKGFSFKPGDDLLATRLIPQLSDPEAAKIYTEIDPDVDEHYFWPDGMIRVTGREYNGLIESPCYKDGNGHSRMSCFSCHSLHRTENDNRPVKEWANDQLKAGMDGNQACLQCHEKFGEDLAGHTHHAIGSSGSLCYNCHMPHTSYGLLGAIRAHQVTSPDVKVTQNTGRPNACNHCHLDKTLAWTAGHLTDWFGHETPKFNREQREVAASVLWLLRGDAGQRAITAWSFGWASAREASGTKWMPPFLAQLMLDPYDTVRFIAFTAQRQNPGFEDLAFDYVAPVEERTRILRERYDAWLKTPEAKLSANSELLIREDGQIDRAAFNALLQKRDDRDMTLTE